MRTHICGTQPGAGQVDVFRNINFPDFPGILRGHLIGASKRASLRDLLPPSFPGSTNGITTLLLLPSPNLEITSDASLSLALASGTHRSC